MKSIVFILLIIMLFNTAYAQHVIQGKLTDEATGEAIPYASVGIKGTSTGTISNDNGEFSINAPALPVTISIGHLSYQAVTIEVNNDNPLQIKLKAAANMLKEVKIGDLALTLMQLASEKAYKQARVVHLAKAFSRQTFVNGDEPSYFTESFFDAQWENWGMITSKITNARYLEKLGGMDYTNINFFAAISCGFIKNSIIITPVCRRPDSLYKFRIKQTLKNNGKEIVVINCQLKDAGKTNSAFAGDIYIDADTYDILKTDGTITKFSLKSNSIISAKLKELRIVSQFKPDDKGNTVLDYSTFSIKSSLKLGIVGFKTTNYTSKIFILSYDDSIDADNLNAIKPNAREKDMDQIRNAPYDAEFWKNNPVIRRTKAEDDAIVYLDQLKNKQGNIK